MKKNLALMAIMVMLSQTSDLAIAGPIIGHDLLECQREDGSWRQRCSVNQGTLFNAPDFDMVLRFSYEFRGCDHTSYREYIKVAITSNQSTVQLQYGKSGTFELEGRDFSFTDLDSRTTYMRRHRQSCQLFIHEATPLRATDTVISDWQRQIEESNRLKADYELSRESFATLSEMAPLWQALDFIYNHRDTPVEVDGGLDEVIEPIVSAECEDEDGQSRSCNLFLEAANGDNDLTFPQKMLFYNLSRWYQENQEPVTIVFSEFLTEDELAIIQELLTQQDAISQAEEHLEYFKRLITEIDEKIIHLSDLISQHS